MSKLKLISGVSVVTVFFLLLQTVSAVAPNSLYIYSPQTGQGTTVFYGPQTVSTSTATSTATNTATTTVATGTSTCVTYMTSFHKYGDNGPEVVKLQNFLNQTIGANLNGLGFYGPATMNAVKTLQNTYGIKVTGYQHEKTTALINSLICGNIALKQPVGVNGGTISGYMGTVSVGGGKVLSTNPNIYPNANAGTASGVVKNYPNKGDTMMVPKETNKATITATTTNSFWDNLKSDFQKIKENYKAYVLVFVLVLALFWFLRKAATE